MSDTPPRDGKRGIEGDDTKASPPPKTCAAGAAFEPSTKASRSESAAAAAATRSVASASSANEPLLQPALTGPRRYRTPAEQLGDEMSRFRHAQAHPANRRVLIIYTGGTFGCDVTEDAQGKKALVPMQDRDFFPVLKAKVPMLKDMSREDPALLAKLPATAPASSTPAGPRFFYHAFSSTLDSTNATPTTWSAIAIAIEHRKFDCDGFVVIQGTDTLYYTTAALTFLMAGTLAPIIVTGAQTPLIADVSDAVMNVTGAVRCCVDVPGNTVSKAHPDDPKQLLGVYLYFNFRLMNGTRCMKIDSHNYGAFTSPNMGYVAHAQPVLVPGERSHVFDMATVKTLNEQTMRLFSNREEYVKNGRKRDWHPFYANKREKLREMLAGSDSPDTSLLMDVLPMTYNDMYNMWLSFPTSSTKVQVAIVRLVPGVDSVESVTALGDHLRSCRGVIVEAYGAGNAQDGIKALLKELRETHNIPVVIITECNHSGVESDYGVAIGPECGALCHDMTLGCAYTRMYLAIYKIDFAMMYESDVARRDRVEEIMCTPMLLCFTPPHDTFQRDRFVAVGV